MKTRCFHDKSVRLTYPIVCPSAGEGLTFLETEDGLPFVGVFGAIRLQHILNDFTSVKTLESDKIVPDCKLDETLSVCITMSLLRTIG